MVGGATSSAFDEQAAAANTISEIAIHITTDRPLIRFNEKGKG
jgi:hypothetical protein